MKRSFLAVLCLPLALVACATVESTTTLDTAQQYLEQGAYDHAYSALAPMAEKGDPLVEERIGNIYLAGHYVTASSEKGYDWLTRAASQGDLLAMNQIWLGCFKFDCDGQPHNERVADYWLGQAAKGGNVDAMVGLAAVYAQGDKATPQNFAQSRAWAAQALVAADADMNTLQHPAPAMQAMLHLRPRRFSADGMSGLQQDDELAACLLVKQYVEGDGVHQNVGIAKAVATLYPIGGAQPSAHAYAYGTLRPALDYMPDCSKVASEMAHAYASLNGDEQVDADSQHAVRLMIDGGFGRAFGVRAALQKYAPPLPDPAVPDIAAPHGPARTLAQALTEFHADLLAPNSTIQQVAKPAK